MSTASKAQARIFPNHNSLPDHTKTRMIETLNQQLADTLDLYAQTKQAHWNVKGKDFYQLHLLFDTHAEHALEWVDLLAERATMIGGYATGTVRMSAAASRLPEYPTDITEGMDHVSALVERWGNYATTVRAAIDIADEFEDKDSADLFTDISRQADMDLWFLEAHLQK
ncbi:MAG: DNA protection during starvation protein [uncultured Thermomicrobiales bacterium]|uniref:DNA protection during starvation protein n=1 Tax=uncultured Thermomicrobiales bacterium TaxID=1645740 RepID=A0A6J4VDI3_9BACT|nr:MAG: DNA protection during starvation protein [uncultured Thermomicrobiales bacterium]